MKLDYKPQAMFGDTLSSILSEAVIDWTRSTLDPDIFTKDEDEYEMRSDVSNFIKTIVDRVDRDVVDVKDWFVKGSLLSFQWRDTTDLDILIEIDKSTTDEERDRLQNQVDDEIGEILVPGTEHPLQIYLNQGQYNPVNADGIYYPDFRERGWEHGWIKGPYNISINVGDYMSKFQKVAAMIDTTTGELKRNIIDYELMRELPKSEVKGIEKAMSEKLIDIEDAVEEIVSQYNHLRDFRHRAFSDEANPAEIARYGSRNELPDNVIFKLLERYYYLKWMRELKQIAEEGDIDDDDDIEMIKDTLNMEWRQLHRNRGRLLREFNRDAWEVDVKKEQDKGTYVLRTEKIKEKGSDMEPMEMQNAYNHNDEWIGDADQAKFLCDKGGIAPEKADPKHCVCSIGFCEKDGKWYGWSHRAIFGFKKGDKSKKGEMPHTDKEFTVTDPRQTAIEFAGEVS